MLLLCVKSAIMYANHTGGVFMKLKKSLLYVLLLCLACFSIGIIHTNAQEDDTFTQTTLYAKDAQGKNIGSAQSSFTQGTQLVMENNPSKLGYGEISRSRLQDAQEVFTYGVSLENGTYEGDIQLSFLLDDTYNGKTANVVLQKANNGVMDYETLSQVITHGEVSITLSAISLDQRTPFLIGIYQTDTIFQERILSQTLDDKEVQIQGAFTKAASMQVSLLSSQDAAYKTLQASIKDQMILNAYKISLETGNYTGILTYHIPVILPEAEEPVQVVFLQANGEVKTIASPVVEAGVLTFSTTEPSSFMIVQEQPVQETSVFLTYLLTYPWQIGIGGVVLLVLAIALYRHHPA